MLENLPEGWEHEEREGYDVFALRKEHTIVKLVFKDSKFSIKVIIREEGICISTPGIDYTEIYEDGDVTHILHGNESVVKIRDRYIEENVDEISTP